MTPYAVPPLWRLLTKFLYFVALAGAIGAPLTHALALRPSLRLAPKAAIPVRHRATTALGIGGIILVVGGYLQLAGRVARAKNGPTYSQALTPGAIVDFLRKPAEEGEWVSTGIMIGLQNLCFLACAILLLVSWRRRDDRPALPAGLIAATGSLIGSIPRKALDADHLTSAIAVQAHIIGGSVWLGGLGLLAAISLTRREGDAEEHAAWAQAWSRFGTVALWSVGAAIASGLWLTRREVGSIEQLWTTIFGRVLLAKLLLVAGLLAAGAWNQLVLMPAIAREQRRNHQQRVGELVLTRFPRVVATETVLGVGVLACVSFLVGSARGESGQPEAGPIALPLLGIGLALIAVMAASFWATTRASAALARLEAPAETPHHTVEAAGAPS
ncbi:MULTISPECIES: CopD family protein [unclassified Luteococcus]|uniref:CopD family protein n=1 Tax=unclassified Luteococcus TaxID=2639923 RepID=UPI00313C15B4